MTLESFRRRPVDFIVILLTKYNRRRLNDSDARKMLGWPKICKLAHAFLWEYSYKRLKFAQLLGQLSVFLT
jgi:hypothetical protein